MKTTFRKLADQEGFPLDLICDHVGQAAWAEHGVNFEDHEEFEMTDPIHTALEECHDLHAEHQEHLNDDEQGEPKWTF